MCSDEVGHGSLSASLRSGWHQRPLMDKIRAELSKLNTNGIGQSYNQASAEFQDIFVSIQEIQASFIAEASSAPLLFGDLAKVEIYIAESYRSRAFIELLQNADDAGARRFSIRQVGLQLVVANDGRPMSRDDIVALCRSGASNKRRGGGTIGYRGIGFKSVAGIAHGIDIVSGDWEFSFSKTLTKHLLSIDGDVPLIRIPHPKVESGGQTIEIGRNLLPDGMTTAFVLYGLDERMTSEEAQAFDETAMLFLNNVVEIEIELSGVSRRLIRVNQRKDDVLAVAQILSGTNQQRWLVASSGDSCAKIAFALDGESIKASELEQAVIHAFMPTCEFAGALLKINGDFSTDPSRKSIDFDDESAKAFNTCMEVLTNLIQQAVANGDLDGIFTPFTSVNPLSGRFRKLVHDSLLEKLDATGFFIGGQNAKPKEIRLPPEWLTYADYENLCRSVPHISQSTLVQHPSFLDFLKWLGATPLSLDEALTLISSQSVSPQGYAQLFSRVARQYRYEMTGDRLDKVANTPLLPVGKGRLTPREYRNEQLHPEFLDVLRGEQQTDDIRYLFRRLSLPEPSLSDMKSGNSQPLELHPVTSVQSSSEAVAGKSKIFNSPPALKAWRSAEKNAGAWLSALENVISVTDVSQANVGYDFDVIMRGGDRLYIEVKSVTRFGDPVRLTNNEHATAYQLGSAYLLALVVNFEGKFEIRFVRDPIRSLALEKRCEQWSWYCDQYMETMAEELCPK